jgi:hypothetical protein
MFCFCNCFFYINKLGLFNLNKFVCVMLFLYYPTPFLNVKYEGFV